MAAPLVAAEAAAKAAWKDAATVGTMDDFWDNSPVGAMAAQRVVRLVSCEAEKMVVKMAACWDDAPVVEMVDELAGMTD